jgi:hypothetical protein
LNYGFYITLQVVEFQEQAYPVFAGAEMIDRWIFCSSILGLTLKLSESAHSEGT